MSDEPAATPEKITAALTAVRVATARYLEAKQQTARARNIETTALNRLNEDQRAAGLLIRQAQKGAPAESDWRSTDRRGEDKL